MNTDKIYAEAIANEYSIKDTSKVVALKKLDRKVKLPSLIFIYSFGTAMLLVLGLGMCLTMKIIESGTLIFVLGIVIGIIGVSINYPIYRKKLETNKKKYAYDIIKLAKQIAEE